MRRWARLALLAAAALGATACAGNEVKADRGQIALMYADNKAAKAVERYIVDQVCATKSAMLDQEQCKALKAARRQDVAVEEFIRALLTAKSNSPDYEALLNTLIRAGIASQTGGLGGALVP